LVDTDPLNVKKYEQGNAEQTKNIYTALAGVPVFLVVGVVFLLLSLLGSSSSTEIASTDTQSGIYDSKRVANSFS
jgi:hypothetical protein